jgi:hypothetical protein
MKGEIEAQEMSLFEKHGSGGNGNGGPGAEP